VLIDTGQYKAWLGRQEECADIIAAAPLMRLAALLDRPSWPEPKHLLPPLGNWLFHLPNSPQSALGIDGHPARGGFLPPIALPRRMWAGSRLSFHRDILMGSEIVRRSTVTDVKVRGEGGDKVFVTVRHELASPDQTMITEDQDIVYLGAARFSSNPPKAIPTPSPTQVRRIVADSVVLFRYSALTFNAHRIHYDRDYATSAEGYPGLVIHGPLIATMLMDHFLRFRPNVRVRAFEFRARAPLFDGMPFDLCLSERDGEADLWAQSPEQGPAVTATILFDEAAAS
jgi:3-methylfumaryl-CoA hydratase